MNGERGSVVSGGPSWSARVLALPPGVHGVQRRRAQTLLGVATAVAVAAVPVAIFVAVALPEPAKNVPVVLIGLLFYAVIRLLVARSLFTFAAWVFLGYFVLVPVNGILQGAAPAPVDVLFIPLIPVMAAVLLPARHVLVAIGVALIDLAIVSQTANAGEVGIADLTTYAVILLATLGAASLVLTLVVDGAFDDVSTTRIEAQRLADELQVANDDLEERVRSRTTELADALQREQRLSAQLAELSLRDSLTGLHNRRHMDETLDRMFRYALRSEHPLSIAIIDLDDFKQVNDRHTHLVGDQVLRHSAAVLAGAIRGSDELVRMGGEEFALLMPGTSAEEALTVCERMRVSLQTHPWDSVVRGIAVTASFGVATTGTANEVAELLREADQQLLLAKRTGKNRVLCTNAGVA
ncbi:MAG: GGDEF domain-containing protein [Actinomycetes bacterium]